MKQAHIKMKLHVTYGETKHVVEESLVENTVGRLFQEKEYIVVFKVLSYCMYMVYSDIQSS